MSVPYHGVSLSASVEYLRPARRSWAPGALEQRRMFEQSTLWTGRLQCRVEISAEPQSAIIGTIVAHFLHAAAQVTGLITTDSLDGQIANELYRSTEGSVTEMQVLEVTGAVSMPELGDQMTIVIARTDVMTVYGWRTLEIPESARSLCYSRYGHYTNGPEPGLAPLWVSQNESNELSIGTITGMFPVDIGDPHIKLKLPRA